MKKWYNMKKAGDVADIYIYSEIGMWGVTASQFITDLVALDNPKTLNIHINSVGGEVWDGWAIYNTLLQFKATKNVIIEGVAASIASVIAMAGDKVSMFETAMFMVHKPWTIAAGNDKDMEKTADILKKIKAGIIKAYMSKAKNISEQDINDLVDEESWMLPEDAKVWGFIDEIITRNDDEKTKDMADIEARIIDCREIVERFKNVPQKFAALVKNLPPVAKEKTELEKKNELLESQIGVLNAKLEAANTAIKFITI